MRTLTPAGGFGLDRRDRARRGHPARFPVLFSVLTTQTGIGILLSMNNANTETRTVNRNHVPRRGSLGEQPSPAGSSYYELTRYEIRCSITQLRLTNDLTREDGDIELEAQWGNVQAQEKLERAYSEFCASI